MNSHAEDRNQAIHIGLLCLPGAPLTSLLGPYEILTMAGQLQRESGDRENRLTSGHRLHLLGETAKETPGNIPLPLHLEPLTSEPSFDWIIVSAAGYPPPSGFKFSATSISWLQAQHHQGARVASSCTGAFFLAESGLLDGKEATTHWRTAPLFQRQYPDVTLREDRLIAQTPTTLCAGGAYAYLEMSLYLVEALYGRTLKNRCARLLNLDTNRQSQSLYSEYWPARQHHDQKIHQIQDWLDTHFATPVQIETLAAQVHLGERHFKRRFKAATGESPLHYLQHLKVEHARQRLENTTESIESIARSVGYEDIGFFRTLFRRRTGKTPAQYRNHYQ